MGLFNAIRGQLRSVIQWENPLPDDLFYRWSDNGDEIKNASKLIVGPGQGCIFVYEGKVEAVFDSERMVELKTANIPFWTTITKFMQAFVSEHKVGLYFFKRTEIVNQKWGTTSMIKYEDPKYKFPVGLRAFGNYSFKMTDPGAFFVNIVGGAGRYAVEDFRQVMGARIIQPLTDFFAESKYTYTDIDAKREELAQGIAAKLKQDFAVLGFEIKDFRIEGTSFDDDTMRRINRIADMTAEAQAAQAVGVNYAQVQQLEAMRDAARNPSGGAGAWMGLGAGIGMGQMMAGMMQMNQPQQAQQPANDPMAKLQKLKQMLDGGLITAAEYDAKKKEILSSM
jgi:membrane protease subunit (stomatin/prohibitin family)